VILEKRAMDRLPALLTLLLAIILGFAQPTYASERPEESAALQLDGWQTRGTLSDPAQLAAADLTMDKEGSEDGSGTPPPFAFNFNRRFPVLTGPDPTTRFLAPLPRGYRARAPPLA